ncbi:MAG: hypothetical protein GY950_28360 [bacterium]|nr:hypothetical protein [bacterium]
MLFLNKVEISELNGIDYNELGVIINRAVENMEQAKAHYVNLKQAADRTPYNQEVISLLVSFDYKTFKKERGLNSAVFRYVKKYLRRGDVRGVFSRLLAKTGVILDKLYRVKEYTDSEKFPELSLLWRLNQDYSETILFGQHAAEIFQTISQYKKI